MKVIGMTGGIASGKTTVLDMLRELGANVIDTDLVVHGLLKSTSPIFKFIVRQFGKGILNEDGEINRARLGEIVFSDPCALAYLEGALHPAVYAETEAWIRGIEAREASTGREQVYVVDGAKVYPELLPHCDSFWVIYAPEVQQLDRLVHQRGVSEEEARRRIAAQVPWEERLRQADVVIDNSGTIDETRSQVEREWKKLVSRPSPLFPSSP
ncbi:MAG: dephospho-CoA kinase [Dehalococcoidia bacterium]|nr:dephospho-CoA kinase [Dehalococcoidia bacterium]